MPKFRTIKLADLSNASPSRTPQERRIATLQRQLGGTFTGWEVISGHVIPVSDRGNKDNMMTCQATHGRAWKLLVVKKGELTRAVGLGFARKYLGIDLKIDDN